MFLIFSKVSSDNFCPGPATLYIARIKEFNSCPPGTVEYFIPEKLPSLSKTAEVGYLSAFIFCSSSLFSPFSYEENFIFSDTEAMSLKAVSISKDFSFEESFIKTISISFSNFSATAPSCSFKLLSKNSPLSPETS